MSIFFTSDRHFYHKKMAKTRGFNSVEDMNEAIIELHNSVVGPDDIVFDLGDVHLGNPNAVAPLLKRLNGKRKILVRGNHDTEKNFKKIAHLYDEVYNGFHDPNWITFDGNKLPVILSHCPLSSWGGQYHGTIHLHGHCHNSGLDLFSPNKLDVGVDVCTVNDDGSKTYQLRPPYPLEEILKIMRNAKETRTYQWAVSWSAPAPIGSGIPSLNVVESPHYQIKPFMEWFHEKYGHALPLKIHWATKVNSGNLWDGSF